MSRDLTPRDLKLMSDTALQVLALRTDARLSAEVARLRAADSRFDGVLGLSLMVEDEQVRRGGGA